MNLSLSLVSSAETAEIIIFSLGSVFLDAGGSTILHSEPSPALSSSNVYIAVNLLSTRNSEHLPPV